MERQSKNHGFTMIEATIAMVLLAVAAAGILLPFSNAMAVQAEGARQTVAANLAAEMMEKVLLVDPNTMLEDSPAGYNNYGEAAGAMVDSEGNLLTGKTYAGFSRSVICQPAKVASVDLVAVTVSVAYENNEITRITTLTNR